MTHTPDREGWESSFDDVDLDRVDLLRRLSAAAPTFGVWKSSRSAMTGRGDIDAVVAPTETQTVERTFTDWAVEHDLRPVYRCEHAGDLMTVIVAVDLAQGTLVELDLTKRKTYRGSTLFVSESMIPLLENDPMGFRRSRRGVEGVLLLFHNGVRWGGRANHTQLRRRAVRELLRDDPAGLHLGARLFSGATRSAQAAATAVAAGQWDARSVLAVEAAFLGRAIAEPTRVARRIWFRLVTKHKCPILRVAYAAGRLLPPDVHSWLDEAASKHDRLDDVA